MTFEDEELLRRVRDGDPRAGRQLFDRCQASVNRRVLRMLGRDDDHNEIVQNVFVEAFRGILAGAQPRHLDSWVLGITNHVVVNELRRRQQWWCKKREPELPDVVDGRASPCENLATEAVIARVYRALKQLPTREYIAYTLKIIEDEPLAEIMKTLKCSMTTAKRTIRQAKDRLRRIVERDPVLREYLRIEEVTHGST